MATYTAQILAIAGNVVKQYGNTSYIKIPYSSLGVKTSFLSMLGGDALEAILSGGNCRIDINMERFTKRGRADVSKNIIYSPSGATAVSSGNNYVTDNIVPQPWEMQIEANIPYDADIGGLIQFAYNITVGSYINTAQTAVMLRKKVVRTLLEKAYESGTPVIFKDDSNTVYENCAIQSIEFLPEAESENHLRIRMTLVEMRIMTSLSTEFIRVSADSSKIGSIIGKSIDVGSSTTTLIGIGLTAIAGTVGRFFA